MAMVEGKTYQIHSAIDPEQEREWIPLPELWGDILLCLGTGLGYHLEKLTQTQEARTVILVDLCSDFLDATAERIAHPNLHIIKLSVENNEIFDEFLHQVHDAFTPDKSLMQVIRHPAAYRLGQDILDMVSADLFLFHQAIQNASATEDDELSAPQPSPRVLLPFGRHFLQQEIVHALQELDIAYQTLDYEEHQDLTQWESYTLRVMEEFRPSLILTINMKGLDTEGILLGNANRLGIPVHTWFVDDPRPIVRAYPQSQWPQIRVWVWEREYREWLMKVGFISPQWLPLAGDPQTFYLANPAPSEQLDLVFTGSAMTGHSLDRIRQAFMWNQAVEDQAWRRANELARGARTREHLLYGLDLPFEDQKNRTWLESLILHMASHVKRRQALQPLLKHGLLLAGDPAGWRTTFPGRAPTLPEIDYRHELCFHYQQSRIQVNLTSLQMPTAVNQRVFDVPLAGGLVLNDQQEDLEQLFKRKTQVTFSDPEELKEKALWFLNHPTECRRFSRQQREQILQQHTYVHRLQKIFAES